MLIFKSIKTWKPSWRETTLKTFEPNLNKQMCFYSNDSTAISLSMLSQTAQAVKGKKKKKR